MKALVTGGYGFIGSNLIKALNKKGVILDIVDDMSSGHENLLNDLNIREVLPELMQFDTKATREQINFYRCDFAYDNILSKVALGHYDVIFHLAAIPRVSFSVENPAETTEVNLMATVKLFDAARYGKTRVVFSSSSSVYGGADTLPTHESTDKNPKSPYAWQKSACENIAAVYGNLYEDSDIVCLRYFNVFGPGQYGDSPYSTAVSAWCHAVKNNLQLRSDGNGTQTRDLCYVDNVVSANILAANYKGMSMKGRCYNIACSDATSNNQILDYFKSNFSDIEIIDAPWRSGDVMHTQADISRAQEELGYEPLVRFWEGLERTIEWWGLKKNA